MLKHLQLSTVQDVIRLAEAAREDDSEREDIDLGTLSAKELAERLAITPAERELLNYLNQLPDNQMAELMALMWLGRAAGAERRRDYPELVKHASENLDHAASYMAEKAPLADYLRQGLAKHEGKGQV
jgi:hypothetical protein